MKRLGLLVLAACVMAAGCDDDATAPSNLPLVLIVWLLRLRVGLRLQVRVHAALRLRLAASDPKRTFRSPKLMSESG